MDRVVEEIIQARVLNLYLTGGEPLMLPWLPEYIGRFRKGHVHVTVTTNGTLLNPRRVFALREAGVNHVQVSLNGSRPEINDPLMSHSFHRIVQGIECLNSAGIAPRVKITVTRQNIGDMPDLVHFLDHFQTEHIHLFEVGPLGRGFQNYKELKPELEEMRILEEWMNRETGNLQNQAGFFSFSLIMHQEGRTAACSLGNPNICSCQILHNGNMIPCTFAQSLPDRNNILEHGFVGAWKRLPLFARYLDADKLTGKCGICEWKQECKGGCRADAYQQGKGVWSEDPLCPHLPKTAGGVT